MDVEVKMIIKIRYVLINPKLFVELKEAGDIFHKYNEDSYYLWGKYKVVTDSNVDYLEFKLDCSMEDVKKLKN